LKKTGVKITGDVVWSYVLKGGVYRKFTIFLIIKKEKAEKLRFDCFVVIK